MLNDYHAEDRSRSADVRSARGWAVAHLRAGEDVADDAAIFSVLEGEAHA